MGKAGKQWNVIQQEGIKDAFRLKRENITKPCCKLLIR